MEQKVTFRCNSCGKLVGLFFLLVMGVIFAYTEDAYAASINLDAEVRGTTILFSWNDVSQTETVTYYALILESADTEAQIRFGETEFLWNYRHGTVTAGETLSWKIKAFDSGRTADRGGPYLVASDTVTVTIPGNGAPQVNAGRDIIVISNEKITLMGTVYDPNDDDIQHRWNQLSGPIIRTFTDIGYHLEFTAPIVTKDEAVLVFKLNATDGVLVGKDTVSITVQNSRPTANAGPDQTVSTDARVRLSASGSSDHDGKLTYLWEQVSGTGVSFSNSSSNMSFKAPDSASNLVFKLTVNDSQYNATDSVSVRVVENSPPNARILPVVDVEAGEIVILNGSRTTDPDDDRLMYRWTQTAGETAIISNNNSPTASFIVPHILDDSVVDRTAKFKLSVSDGTFTDTATTSIYFVDNAPPVVHAFGHVSEEYEHISILTTHGDADYTAPRGVVFVLNGSSSTDRDVLTYQWRQVSGVSVQLNNANTHTATFNTEIDTHVSILEFELRVSDTAGNSDTVMLTVAIDGILHPVSDAGRDIEARPGTTVLLDGSGSVDPIGGDLDYSWAQTGGETVNLLDRNKVVANFTAPATTNVTKTLSFSLTVETHSAHNTDEVNVHVIPQNIDPIADAGNNMRVDGGANVTLDGTDSVGNNLSYSWQQSTGASVTLIDSNTATPSFIAPNNTRQIVLGFTLTVTDSANMSDSDQVHITVGHDAPPTADAGYNINTFTGSNVVLRGDGSDPEQRTLSYSWSQTGGTKVTLSSSDSSVASFVAPSTASELSFTLTVMDPGGNSATDRMMVNVLANESQVPTVSADAGHDQTSFVNGTVYLDGGSSIGTDLSYSWIKTSGVSVSLSNNTASSPTFTAPSAPSVIVFKLTVNSGNHTASDSVKITIIEPTNDPPTADAGIDMTVSTRESVTLSGSGSDPDGDRMAYSWTQTGGTDVTLKNFNNASASFTAPDLTGTLTFVLTVVDSTGQAGSDSINIMVDSTLPVADAGPNQSVEPGVTVNLDGRSSYDPDSNRLTYSWMQTNGTDVGLTGTSGSTPSFRSPNVTHEVLVFELTVTDNDDNVGTDSVSVTVVSLEPTADAGDDQFVKSGIFVRLDGSDTIEGAGYSDYLWTQTSGGVVELEDANSPIAAFVASAGDAVLEFKLTITNGVYSDSDTITVTIDGNNAPSVGIDADRNVKSGERVELRGLANDPDNAVLSYQWRYVSGPDTHIYDDRTATSYFIAPDVSGTQAIVIKLVVTDHEGGTDSDMITINVRENQSPVAVLEHSHLVVATGGRGTLDASGSYDPDNDALSYEWVHYDGPVLSISGSGERVSFIAPAVGNVLSENIVYMTLKVTDGAITDSVGLQVEITNDNSLNAGVPTANAGTDMAVTPRETVTLSGSGSDLDGDRLTYSWTQTSGHGVTLTDSDKASASFTAPDLAGTLTFMLTVSDSNGQSESDSVNVTVEATVPVADAGSSQSVETGVTVNLDGRSSYDPDSNQLSYSWTQIVGTEVSLTGTSGSTPSFTSPNVMEDVLIFELTVTDDDGNADTDSVSVTVVTLEPTADAGDDQSVRSGTYVMLDGSGSIEGIGTTGYSWTQTGGATVVIDDADRAIAGFMSPDNDAFLTFKLTATNGAYNDSDIITVTIDGNDAPSADAGADIHAISNETVNLKGFANDLDSTDLIHQWSQESGPSVHIYNSHTLTPHFISPEVISGTQTIVIKFVVTDYDGGTDSDIITITVSEYIFNPN